MDLKEAMEDEGFIIHTVWLEYSATLAPDDFKEFWSCIVSVKNGHDPTPCKNQTSNFMLAVILPSVKKAKKRYAKKKQSLSGTKKTDPEILPDVELPDFAEVAPVAEKVSQTESAEKVSQTESAEKVSQTESAEKVSKNEVAELYSMWDPDYRKNSILEFEKDFETATQTAGLSPRQFFLTCRNFWLAQKINPKLQPQAVNRFALRKDIFKFKPGNFTTGDWSGKNGFADFI